ncbi:MAG: hypothetical protein BWX72_00198 [Firmicutes bacterium ADurb.Bin080]|jgi:hypothetical protein|nr:MAG: hypothetical protein BWX72_00198 [Firmicutes bacterium ADurb.Bin080]
MNLDASKLTYGAVTKYREVIKERTITKYKTIKRI